MRARRTYVYTHVSYRPWDQDAKSGPAKTGPAGPVLPPLISIQIFLFSEVFTAFVVQDLLQHCMLCVQTLIVAFVSISKFLYALL